MMIVSCNLTKERILKEIDLTCNKIEKMNKKTNQIDKDIETLNKAYEAYTKLIGMDFLKRYQTKLNNCFSTCVANILFLNNEELNKMPQHDEDDWFQEYQKYLKKFGYQILCVIINNLDNLPDTLCIMTGKSPYTKGTNHSVIGRKGKIVFDPKEENLGLKGSWKNWEYCFLIPANSYRALSHIINDQGKLNNFRKSL